MKLSTGFLKAQGVTNFCEGITKFDHKWTKCTKVKGDYIKNNAQIFFIHTLFICFHFMGEALNLLNNLRTLK